MNGARIKNMREARGWTQEYLAETLNIPVLQINRYENGKTQPNADMIRRLAAGLMCSADYLLGLTDDPNPRNDDEELNLRERLAITAWRRGDFREAIKVIVDDE